MHILQQKLLQLSEKENLSELSLRKIARLIQESSPQKIKHHLLQLERNGLLKLDRIEKIMIKTRPGPIHRSNLLAIPILGSANCGPATIYAEQNIEGYLRISGKLVTKKKGIFAIKALGYSMNRANIGGESVDDGDYVVVDPKARIKNGDYVLSIIDGMANIKRFFEDKANSRIILLAESSASFSPIFIHKQDVDQFLVNGKIIQVIKKPKSTLSKFKNLIYRSLDAD